MRYILIPKLMRIDMIVIRRRGIGKILRRSLVILSKCNKPFIPISRKLTGWKEKLWEIVKNFFRIRFPIRLKIS